jgi:hypothetical protein
MRNTCIKNMYVILELKIHNNVLHLCKDVLKINFMYLKSVIHVKFVLWRPVLLAFTCTCVRAVNTHVHTPYINVCNPE